MSMKGKPFVIFAPFKSEPFPRRSLVGFGRFSWIGLFSLSLTDSKTVNTVPLQMELQGVSSHFSLHSSRYSGELARPETETVD